MLPVESLVFIRLSPWVPPGWVSSLTVILGLAFSKAAIRSLALVTLVLSFCVRYLIVTLPPPPPPLEPPLEQPTRAPATSARLPAAIATRMVALRVNILYLLVKRRDFDVSCVALKPFTGLRVRPPAG